MHFLITSMNLFTKENTKMMLKSFTKVGLHSDCNTMKSAMLVATSYYHKQLSF